MANNSISSKARIGSNVKIGDFAVIEDDVEIGDNVEIGSCALIADGARISNNVKISHGAVIATEPQDLKFGGEETTVEIGEGTVIREYATVNRGTNYHKKTVVGKNCLIMSYAHVAHDCIVGDNVILANSVNMGGHVVIEDNVIIGGIVAVHQFVNIGRNAIIGGGFRVVKDVPPFIMAGGYPLKYEGLNKVGLRRRGFSPESIEAIDSAYKLIYSSQYNVSDAVRKIRENNMTGEVKLIVEFIEKSQRGIIKG